MKVINVGKDNATFQQIYALKENRNKRAQTKMFFVETKPKACVNIFFY